MIKNTTLGLLFIGLALSAKSQTVLFEEDFNAGIPATWSVFDQDGLAPASDVAEFTSAWIGKIVGSDTAAASTSYYSPAGTSNDFLITPKIAIGNFSKIVWSARSVDASYPDGYQVLVSTTDSLPASFTDTIRTVTAETGYLTTRSSRLDIAGYANQDVYIAFRNNTDNGYILLIDNVKVLGAETAGIKETSLYQPEISLYPNPVIDLLQINSSDVVIGVSIYSNDGRLVVYSTETELNVSSLESGFYIALIETENGVSSSQFIKR